LSNRKTVDQCGVMLYQSMSGDSASGANTFSNYDKSTIQIQSSSSIYFSALILFITHAKTKINLEEWTFKYSLEYF